LQMHRDGSILSANIALCEAAAKLLRVVLTGGPCGGKSSALATLKDRLSRRGFQVGDRSRVSDSRAARNQAAMAVSKLYIW
jgi:putative protein kinase ArgK-like GTPase of G3E family